MTLLATELGNRLAAENAFFRTPEWTLKQVYENFRDALEIIITRSPGNTGKVAADCPAYFTGKRTGSGYASGSEKTGVGNSWRKRNQTCCIDMALVSADFHPQDGQVIYLIGLGK